VTSCRTFAIKHACLCHIGIVCFDEAYKAFVKLLNKPCLRNIHCSYFIHYFKMPIWPNYRYTDIFDVVLPCLLIVMIAMTITYPFLPTGLTSTLFVLNIGLESNRAGTIAYDCP